MTEMKITEEREVPAVENSTGLLAWVTTIDHKRLGIMYLLGAAFFAVIGGIEAMLIRAQLVVSEFSLLEPQTFNQLFSLHGTTMIFFVAMPLVTGLGTYFVPLMIGARDMAFPRLNAMGFWVYFFGGLLLYFGTIAHGAPEVGWFSYAPLSEEAYSLSKGTEFFSLSLLVAGIGSVGSAINFIVTILTCRTPGMTIARLPLFVWMVFVDAVLIPSLTSGIKCSAVHVACRSYARWDVF